jgi:hypothetical protein
MLHSELDLHVSHNRIVMVYFFASLSFLVAGLSLCLFTQTFYFIGFGHPFSWATHPYEDLGLRLYAVGIFLVLATFYQSLIGERRSGTLRLNRRLS